MFQIQSVGIVGSGLMGSGIAEVAALAGLPVVLVKATGGDVGPVRERIRAAMAARIAKGKLGAGDADAALERIAVATDLVEIATCELVIEAIVEDLSAKRALFDRLHGLLGPTAVLASNTSNLAALATVAAAA